MLTMNDTTRPKNPGGRPRLPDEEKTVTRSVRLTPSDWQWLDAQPKGPGEFFREAVRKARAKETRANSLRIDE